MGNVLPNHPRTEEIVEEYLKQENERIAQENEQKKEREKTRRKFYQSN